MESQDLFAVKQTTNVIKKSIGRSLNKLLTISIIFAIIGGLIGGINGVIIGMFFGLNLGDTICIQHMVVFRLFLYQSKLIPWNYAHFLDYCTERLLLQRVGGRYRFVHKLLQEHFAEMSADSP